MELLDRAEMTPLSERDLVGLGIPADPGPALRRALDERRAEAFTAILLVALHRGDSLDSALLRRGAPLLPDAAVLAAVCGRLQGAVAPALIEAVGDGKLGWDLDAIALLLAAYWSRREGLEDPPLLLRKARSLARKAPGGLADVALAALLGLTDDAGLEAGLGAALDAQMQDDARELAEGLVARFMGPVLSAVPETAGSRSHSSRPIRRAVAKVGRNAPCPCGSGKKYKSCHARIDAERQADASDVAGLTRTELRERLSEHLSAERLNEMRAHELAAVLPAKVPSDLVSHWLDRLCFHREYSAMEEAYRELDNPDLDALLCEHAGDAAWNGDRAAALALLALHHGDEPALRIWARAALSDDPAEVGALAEASALEHLDDAPIEAAYAMLRGPWPALGVLTARGLIPLIDPRDGDALLAEVLDVREDLGLEPWDPVEDVLYSLVHGRDPDVAYELEQASKRLSANQAQLQGAAAELRALRDQLEARRDPVATAPPNAALTAAPAPADPDAEDLRRRISELRGELKNRHAERNALRRELRDVKAQADSPAPANDPVLGEREPESAPDPDVHHDGKLRLPTWSRDFRDAIERVPAAVARAAVEKLSAVAVGREGAFHEVRRLRGREWLWRAKVGRSYRLLFRMDDESIEALDLVHRQDLEKRIKQLGG